MLVNISYKPTCIILFVYDVYIAYEDSYKWALKKNVLYFIRFPHCHSGIMTWAHFISAASGRKNKLWVVKLSDLNEGHHKIVSHISHPMLVGVLFYIQILMYTHIHTHTPAILVNTTPDIVNTISQSAHNKCKLVNDLLYFYKSLYKVYLLQID